MRKTYKCSNIKFCMEDENQRRTWEYLQGVTRKDGSYGKILSDAFVGAIDGKTRLGMDQAENVSAILKENDDDVFWEMLDRVLEEKLHKILPKLQEVFAEQISRDLRKYASDLYSGATDPNATDGMGQMQEAELSEDMMAFAFAMGE